MEYINKKDVLDILDDDHLLPETKRKWIDEKLKVCEVFDMEITDFLKPNDEDIGKPCYKIYVITERRRFANSCYNYFCDTVGCFNYWKKHILNGGDAVLYVRERPFVKSDRLKLGKTVFWTKEEAEKAIGIIYEPQTERSE